jgi:hypothetical protein
MLMPNTLEKLLAALDANPSAALAIAHERIYIDEHGCPIGNPKTHYHPPGLVRGDDVLRAQCYHTGSVAVESQVLARTKALLDKAGFDPFAAHCCDNDLYCRVCEEWDVFYVAGTAVRTREHSGTLSCRAYPTLELAKADLKVMTRLLTTSQTLRNDPRYRRAMLRYRAYEWFSQALSLVRKGHCRSVFWILCRLAKFEPWPWWVPYFVYKRSRESMVSIKRRSLKILFASRGRRRPCATQTVDE